MPGLDFYRRNITKPITIGQVHKIESDRIMEATWNNDITSRIGYLYDQEHDDEFETFYNLNPQHSKTKIPVEIKFYEMEYNSLAKDEVSQHIMFKPSYEPNVPYYDEKFAEPLKAEFPIGLYCDIEDSRGTYQRWLIVGQYREHGNQFPSYLVLPCNHKLQWVYNGYKYESWCVLRSQNSYNAGVWSDYRFTAVENQKIVWLSNNELTRNITYDQRVVISDPREIPIVWSCSKVESMNVLGIARYTFKQDLWDEHTDYIEKDKDGNIIGMWASYYTNGEIVPTTPTTPSSIYSQVTYSGKKAEILIGGSYKKMTVTFYDDAEDVIPHRQGTWNFTIDDIDAHHLVDVKTWIDDSTLQENQIKIQFIGNDDYINKALTIGYESIDGIKSSVQLNIIG